MRPRVLVVVPPSFSYRLPAFNNKDFLFCARYATKMTPCPPSFGGAHRLIQVGHRPALILFRDVHISVAQLYGSGGRGAS